jgi:FADH2 O2-dependent halogenase
MSSSQHDYDMAVIGGSFAGSLTALLLRQIGYSVLLVDRGHHPRFAIGESSTPAANLILRTLGHRYRLPELIALSRYGSWKRDFGQLDVGLKRGFSYFGHTHGTPFRTSPDHDRELLVAASTHDDVSDTQWLRADFDAWMLDRARQAGVEYLADTRVTAVSREQTCWTLRLVSRDSSGDVVEEDVDVPFVIEASGLALEFAGHLGVTTTTDRFRTNSRAVFAHFRDLPRWEVILDQLGVARNDYPFRCDDAALHHLFDDGWMWQLRFDSGVTSAGFAINGHRVPACQSSARDEWDYWLARLPSVRDQFLNARIVAPENGLALMPRLQRRCGRLCGPGWVGLPNLAGFVDPLFSAGNAHLLAGIERVVRTLEERPAFDDVDLFAEHARMTFAELAWIDALVAGCYDTLADFNTARAMTAWYFAAAVAYEQHRLSLPEGDTPRAFLMADDPTLRTTAETCHTLAATARFEGRPPPNLVEQVRTAIAPWDAPGLLDPASNHMIHRTALE